MIEPWKRIRSTLNRSYRVFSVRTDTCVSPRTGNKHDFYILESRSWVNVIPMTPERDIVMVRQYRHGSGEVTLEIPGGLVDPGDTPEEAASRELLEETGYQAQDWVKIGEVNPNPALFNNRCYTYLAENVRNVARPSLDQTEDIEVVLIPIADILEMIRSGKIDHAIVIAAFSLFFISQMKTNHIPDNLQFNIQSHHK
jgi:ADP-ribose pyrophosphatase